jgi:hypothetical protein
MRTESTLRRRADKYGLKLAKLRESNRDYRQYGPYMLIDVHTGGAYRYGMDLEQVEDEL